MVCLPSIVDPIPVFVEILHVFELQIVFCMFQRCKFCRLIVLVFDMNHSLVCGSVCVVHVVLGLYSIGGLLGMQLFVGLHGGLCILHSSVVYCLLVFQCSIYYFFL